MPLPDVLPWKMGMFRLPSLLRRYPSVETGKGGQLQCPTYPGMLAPFLPSTRRAGPEWQASSGRQKDRLQEKALSSQNPEDPFLWVPFPQNSIPFTNVCHSNQVFALAALREIQISCLPGTHKERLCVAVTL